MLKISDRVLYITRIEEISFEELETMIEHAAVTSLRDFNYRYFHWLLKIENDVLVDMQNVDLVEIGKGENRQLEEHDECEGVGCKECGWIGEVGRWVTDKMAPTHMPLGYKREVYKRA